MSTIQRGRRFCAQLLGVALLCGGVSAAQAQTAAPEVLQVPVGSHKLLRLPTAIGRVAIGDPKVADINVVNAKELLLLGKAAGTTSLLVWPRASGRKSAANGPREYAVSVGGLAGLPADPTLATMTVQPGGGIGGTAPDLLAHNRAAIAAGSTEKAALPDRSVVALDSQVLSEIKVVEVNKTSLQQYGLNLFHNSGRSIQGFSSPGSLSGVQSSSGTSLQFTSSNGFLPLSDAFNIVFGNNNYLGILSLLERKGLAQTLAEPSLTATSGQLATFLAGGEFPVPVPQSSGGSGTGGATVTIQYKEFGVRLNLTPTVLASNRISLKVAPEVSELDYANGVNLNGFVVPGLIVRRTDTTVELGDGETFILSGLVSNTMKANVDKVPFLGDIPILGAFFKTNTYSRSEKELIMVVTPHLVRPFVRDAQLPALPGAGIPGYRPNFAETMLFERGDFGQDDHGYSR